MWKALGEFLVICNAFLYCILMTSYYNNGGALHLNSSLPRVLGEIGTWA
jgi:hypothetical protein